MLFQNERKRNLRGIRVCCRFRFFDRRDFQYVEMDTDSAYMALSGPLESIVHPDKREAFYEEFEQWFPRPFCDAHRVEFFDSKLRGSGLWDVSARPCCARRHKHDMRTPGLFKEQFEGSGIVALNSKTYFCWSDTDNKTKYSCKGLSKTTNQLTK